MYLLEDYRTKYFMHLGHEILEELHYELKDGVFSFRISSFNNKETTAVQLGRERC